MIGVLKRVLKAVGFTLLIAGCAANNTRNETKPSWAGQALHATCEGSVGAFERAPVVFTPWESSDYDPPLTDLLSVLVDEEVHDVSNGPFVVLTLLDSSSFMRITTQSGPEIGLAVNCEMGVISISRSRRAQSEATASEHQTTQVTLWTTDDGSLLVRRRFKAKGLGFLLVPFRVDVTQWLKYERAS